MPGMGQMNRATNHLMLQTSGTTIPPRSWPMPALTGDSWGWNLMWMGQVFLNATWQDGPRGDDALYSTNWGMFAAARPLGNGAVMVRGMISAEPLSVLDREYPLLFQTGESAFGKPIVDGQHPHDLFMEIAGEYAYPLGETGIASIYYGAIGSPALGPAAFPHRASAAEIPQAPLAHHWQDSTHIASNVVTASIGTNFVGIEASAFHGEEPDENRWNIDAPGKVDSWSSRFRLSPHPNWSGQFSLGRLDEPETFHEDDILRLTASIHHVVPRGNGRSIATTLAWGQNRKSIERTVTNAVLAETVVPFRNGNYVTGRLEWSQRDELLGETEGPGEAFDVTAGTIGYTRDLENNFLGSAAIGTNVTKYWVEPALHERYDPNPWGATVFIRLRLGRGF